MKKIVILIIIICSFFCSSFCYTQTILSPGELAIIGINCDDPDDFGFLLLVDIEKNTEIHFTDNGWTKDDDFRGNEGMVTFTAPTALFAGTVIEYQNNKSWFSDPASYFALSASGDQLFAFQGTETSPNFIYAVQTNSSTWQADAKTSNDSAIPSGLTNGVNAVAVGKSSLADAEYDNAHYDGDVLFTSPSQALAAISDRNNWEGSDANRYTFLTGWTLPVTLSAFTAQCINNVPTLYWETQSEQNNQGWFVYRNTEQNRSSAEQVSGFIAGYGTTSQPQSYIYEDNIEELPIDGTLYYWLQSIDFGGIVHNYETVAEVHIIIPDPDDDSHHDPSLYGLCQNVPNPFCSETSIRFSLPAAEQVSINIYNMRGEKIKNLFTGVSQQKSVRWDGSNDAGVVQTSGVYFYELTVNGKISEMNKLLLIR